MQLTQVANRLRAGSRRGCSPGPMELSDVTKAAAIFVHGIFPSKDTWIPLIRLLEKDAEVSHFYRLLKFDYSSPKCNWRPDRRIPDYNTIAGALGTFIENCADYTHLVLVGHSQGGLIIQRYLAEMLAEGRGTDLCKIRLVVLLACPNNGSELFRSLRTFFNFFKLWKHPQERELRPLAPYVVETQRRVLNRIVNAKEISPASCPIRFAVYAAESDNVVTLASAKSVFPRASVLPGDHSSILQAESTESRTFTTLRMNLLDACTVPETDPDLPLRESPQPSVRRNHDASSPILRVTTTTTTTQNQVTESQEIEIFDLEVAHTLIRNMGSSLKDQDNRESGSDVR